MPRVYTRRSVEERFWSKVDKSGGPNACWPWLAATDEGGYGLFNLRRGEMERSHRFAWMLTNGAIPDGQKVLHSCDNPPCANPWHLFLGTHVDNMADMTRKRRHWNTRKTSCLNGHEFTPDNTYTRESDGRRDCRTCSLARKRAVREAALA